MMKRNVVKSAFILLVSILFIFKILPLFLPIKYAVKVLPYSTREYIIVKGIVDPDYKWRIVGNKEGTFPDDIQHFSDINLEGNAPMYKFNGEASSLRDRFICYGEYVYQPYDGIRGYNINGEYVYNVDHWDIMYPVHRDLFIGVLIPRGYLCRYDYCYAKGYTFREMLDGLYIWNYKTLPYDK